MISVSHVSFRYSNGVQALNDVSVNLPRENVLAILGESGSGKTTLLRCIGRFLQPKHGRIALDDRSVGEILEIEFRRAIGIVFQQLHLFPHLTCIENLTLAPTKVFGDDKEVANCHAREMLKRLGIQDFSDQYPSQISGGQAQRVAIARSLMLSPEYLLLDEPTSALDFKTTTQFADWLLELKTETTFIVVTHDIPFAEQVASMGVMLADGKVTARGTIEEIVEAQA